jgi:N-acetylneuraminic acid mutarotase
MKMGRFALSMLCAILAVAALRCGGGDNVASTGGGGTETIGFMGVFVDTLGSPVPGARVVATGADSTVDTVSTDRHGAYLFAGVPAGTYTLQANYSDSELVARVTGIRADSITYNYGSDSLLVLIDSSLQIPANYVRTDTMRAPGSISGVVAFDAADMGGTHVYIPGTSFGAWTDSQGRFVMSGVPSGVYTVYFSRDGYITVVANDVVVWPGQNRVLPTQTLALSPEGAPPAPKNLQASYDTLSGTVALAWGSVPVSDVAGYRVYLDTGSTQPVLLTAVLVTDTVWTCQAFGLSDSRACTLRYHVKAFDTLSEASPPSYPVSMAVVGPAYIATTTSFAAPGAITMGDSVRVVATCTNPGRHVEMLRWYVDRPDSTSLARQRTGLHSHLVRDTLVRVWPDSGAHWIFLAAIDDGGALRLDSTRLTVHGEIIPRDTIVSLAPLTVARRWLSATAMAGKVYAVGGATDRVLPPDFTPVPTALATVECLAPDAPAWQSLTDLITPRLVTGLAAIRGTLYAIGGRNYDEDLATIEAWDTLGGPWRTLGQEMPATGQGMAVCVMDSLVYVFGGVTNDGLRFVLSNAVDVFNPADGSWRTVTTMASYRAYHQATFLNGKVYLLGGYGGASSAMATAGPLSSVEVFDPATGSVTPVAAALPQARMYFGAAALNGRIYVLGGVSSTSYDTPLNSIVSWAPGESWWRPQARSLPAGLHSFATCVSDNGIYVIGGSSGSNALNLGQRAQVMKYYP